MHHDAETGGPPFVLRFRFARVFFYFPTSNQGERKEIEERGERERERERGKKEDGKRHVHANSEWVESIITGMRGTRDTR